MKKIFVVFYLLLFIVATHSIGQNSELKVNIDILKEIQSPAATLVGIANTEIAKPSDPTAFMVSLRQATNNFSTLPLNYAVDLAPVWLWNAKNITAESFLSSKPRHSIPQTLVISTAINNDDVFIDANQTTKNTALAFGFKFSVLRGNVSKATLVQIGESIKLAKQQNRVLAGLVEEEQENSAEWQAILAQFKKVSLSDDEIASLQLRADIELAKISAKAQARTPEKLNQLRSEFNAVTQNLDFTRQGFKLDFNTAVSLNFQDQVYSNGKLDKAGAWVTGGYEWKSGFSLLSIARFLYNPDALYVDGTETLQIENRSVFNTGIRLYFTRQEFSCSIEAISQSIWPQDSEVASGLKYLLNAEYKVSDNMKLTFTFGKDFNGMITREDNVISALNFLMGFGSNRKISDNINN